MPSPCNSQQPNGLALCFHQLYGPFVERDEALRSKPAPFMGNDAIGKITARVQQSQPSFYCMSVHHNVPAVDQASNRFRYFGRRDLVALRQHPDQLAERRQRQRDDIRARQFRLSDFALPFVVARNGSNEDVGIGRHLHRLPVQPRTAISLISSIDKDGPFFLFKKLKTSEILPVGRTAFISIRPSESLSTVIFSPGCTPICFRRSLRSVTCPLAVTVSVLIAWSRVKTTNVRQKRLTIKSARARSTQARHYGPNSFMAPS